MFPVSTTIFSNNNEAPDIILTVEEHEYYVHKTVLSKSSDIFDIMFNGSFKEAKQEKVEIKDVSKVAFKLLLESIYNVDDIVPFNYYWKSSNNYHLKQKCHHVNDTCCKHSSNRAKYKFFDLYDCISTADQYFIDREKVLIYIEYKLCHDICVSKKIECIGCRLAATFKDHIISLRLPSLGDCNSPVTRIKFMENPEPDLILLVDRCEFFVHWKLLASISEYFKVLAEELLWAERFEIKGVSIYLFCELMKAVYSDECNLRFPRKSKVCRMHGLPSNEKALILKKFLEAADSFNLKNIAQDYLISKYYRETCLRCNACCEYCQQYGKLESFSL